MSPKRLQSDLDQEQAAADLDQKIADREQARADREQEPLDAAQRALGDAAVPATADPPSTLDLARAGLALAQDRADVHQAQLDKNQRGQSLRQDLLDVQQAALARHQAGESPAELDAARATAAQELEDALRLRADGALARAEDERRRAVDAVQRLEAMKLRREAGDS